jgi:hypothetical protein
MKTAKSSLLFVAIATWLTACGNDNDVTATTPPPAPPPAMASFDITVENLTNAQPLSPVAVVAHQAGFTLFVVGDPASAGLEELAEGGDNTRLLADAAADANVIATASGAAPVGPAGLEIVTVEVLESDRPTAEISIASMLVNTNDAFTVIGAAPVGSLAVDDSWTALGIAYDAGTEANSEAAADIPGPAGGGEGFNAARNDSADHVAMHAGIISRDDGSPASDLSNQHRFDNPVMRVSITRTR